jgi:hypothetical protein
MILTGRRRTPRGISLTFPAGFVELTTRREPRHSYWEQELAAYYPELDRAIRSRVLSLLESQDPSVRLGGFADDVRLAVGLAVDGRQPRGVVVLSVTAVKPPDGWSPGDLARGLADAATSRTTLRVRELQRADAVTVLVERDRTDFQHTDVFLADRAVRAVIVVSAFCVASTPVNLLPTLTDLVDSYRRC